MEAPEYLLCLNCESPCYAFEWTDGEITDPFCEVCGEEAPEQFMTEEEYEAMMTAEG